MQLILATLAARGIKRLANRRLASVTWPGGVVSFTFDDFPKSSLITGGKILEQHGARGTYYAALQLAGTTGALGQMFDLEDIRGAHHAGHEIACHTFTHLDCAHVSKSSIRAELFTNAAALSSLIEKFVPTNFAYPYGSVSRTAKRVAGRRFSSCRGIRPGINRDTVDFDELRANRIYVGDFDEARMFHLIDQATSTGSWVIFYTHDVSETPSPYGCTPEQLKAVIAYAARRAAILTVRDIVEVLRTPKS